MPYTIHYKEKMTEEEISNKIDFLEATVVRLSEKMLKLEENIINVALSIKQIVDVLKNQNKNIWTEKIR